MTHNTFYSQPAAVEFLVNGLMGRPQNLDRMDLRKSLPDRRLLRGAVDAGDIRSGKEKGAQAGTPAAATRRKAAEQAPLRITVTNGDLTYVSEPLLIGHYRSAKLSGAEAVMDRAIGEAMSASLERGLYPTAAGTQQVFVNTRQSTENPWQLPRPAAVIVAGLGAEGELRGSDLVKTVRQAVIAWGQRLTERPEAPAAFSLATTLLGSGGTGISAGQAAQLIAQGVREANDQMSGERNERRRWPCVSDLHIIELYLDRATEAWRSLQELATSSPALYSVDPVIEEGIGALRRPPDGGYRGAEYDFISALMHKGEDQEQQIVYTIDTKRARSEVRAQATQLPLIRNLVSTASNSANADEQIGRTLFSLLVPVDLEPFMGSSAATVIQLDSGTAAIPWELLDSVAPGQRRRPSMGDSYEAASQAADRWVGRRGQRRVRRRQRAGHRRSRHATGNVTRDSSAHAEKRWPSPSALAPRVVGQQREPRSACDLPHQPAGLRRHGAGCERRLERGDEPCVANHPHRRPR